MDETPAPPRKTPSSRPPASDRASERQAAEPPPLDNATDRFAAGLLMPMLIAALFANAIGGLLAPGAAGTLRDSGVVRFAKWANATGLAATTLGLGALVALVFAVVQNNRTSASTRLVATFGAGLVFTLVTTIMRNEPAPPLLIVLFAGGFAVLVASAVEAVARPHTRALGLQLGLLALSSMMRVGAWALAWGAIRSGHPNATAWASRLTAVAIVFELTSVLIVLVYLAHRPGWRGAAAGTIGLSLALVISMWALSGTEASSQLRQLVQRAISMRVQWGGPLPSWVDPQASVYEIGMLDRAVRTALLPLVCLEIGSLTLSAASLAAASRTTMPVLAAMGLALVSRGQADQPLRALELAIAGLGGLVLARGAATERR